MKYPEDISPDFPEWPDSWHGMPVDITYGQGIIDEMRPFIIHLIESGLKNKTLKKHMTNLWLLGGEIIRDVSLHDEYDIPPAQYLKKSIGSCGGPYCRHLNSEAEENSYDATCRKLHKFPNLSKDIN